MALDPTPWFVSTPGAEHSSDVARVLAFAATGGRTGVVGSSGSLRVSALASPGAQVHVASGVAVAPSRYTGHAGQSYIMRNATATNVAIAPTTTSGGRTDAIIIRVDDVALTGQPPSDPTKYDYTKFQVIQGVSANLRYAVELNLNFPFVLLAKVTLPANTSAVTAAMVTDLRDLVLGREETVTRTYAQVPGDPKQLLTATNAYPHGQYFPIMGGDEGAMHDILVPEWATEMEIRAEWMGVAMHALTGNGQVWVSYDLVRQNMPAYATQSFRWASSDTAGRQNWTAIDTVTVPKAYRGRVVRFALRANRTGASSSTKEIWTDAHSGLSLTIRFMERAD